MRVRSAQATALLLAVVLGGCSQTMRVSAQADSTANWRAYRRYAWASNEPHVVTPPAPAKTFAEVDATVRRAVEQALTAKGYVKDEYDAPDFLVNYRMVYRNETTDTFQDYYWYKRTGGEGYLSEAFTMGYEEATLHLEFATPQTGWAIWRATASAVAEPKTQQAQIEEAVRLMFEKLPPAGATPVSD